MKTKSAQPPTPADSSAASAAEALGQVLDSIKSVASTPAVAGDRLFFPNGIEVIAAKVTVAGVEISIHLAGPKAPADFEATQRTFALPWTAALQQLPSPGTGYYSYEPSTNQYGTIATIAAVVDVGASFAATQPGFPFGVGDISLRNGGPMPGHTTGHQQGRNVDIRLIRKDRKQQGTDIHSSDYDRNATKMVIDAFLAHANVASILFNDTTIPNVTPAPNHDNHFHVQMKA